MGQIGRPTLPAAAVAALGVAAGGLLLTGCGGSPADAATTLRSAAGAHVIRADGTREPARAGLTLVRGDEVVTGAHGSATLVTGSRSVTLIPRSAVTVLDGVHQQVASGTAVADAVAGDGLTVTVDGYTVSVPEGSAARVTAGVTEGVGALAGPSSVRSVSGADLRLPALSQVAIGGDALPTSTTALHLTDDHAEAAAVPALVREDELLVDLAHGIDGSGAGATSTVDAAWSTSDRVDRITRGTSRSERVLPIVMARTAAGDRQAAYGEAVTWRAQGGSWGVVARRLGLSAPAVAAELSALQRVTGGGLGRVTTASLLAAPAGVTGAGGSGGAPRGSAPSTSGPGSAPTSPTPSGGGRPGGGPTSTPPPRTSPGPSRGLVGGAVHTVHSVLGPVTKPVGTIVHRVTKALPVKKLLKHLP